MLFGRVDHTCMQISLGTSLSTERLFTNRIGSWLLKEFSMFIYIYIYIYI